MNTLQLSKIKQYLLQEIGENTAKPYKWKVINSYEDDFHKEDIYGFTTSNKVKYEVVIKRSLIDNLYGEELRYEVEFGIRMSKNKISYTATSNDTATGDWRGVMATVIDIVKEEVLTDTFAEENGLSEYEIVMKPAKRDDEDTRRANLYLSFIEKNIPKDKDISLTTRSSGNIRLTVRV